MANEPSTPTTARVLVLLVVLGIAFAVWFANPSADACTHLAYKQYLHKLDPWDRNRMAWCP